MDSRVSGGPRDSGEGRLRGEGSAAVAAPSVRAALLRNARDPGKRPGQADPPPSYNAGEKLHSRGENPDEGPSCCPGQRLHCAETPQHTRAGAIRAGFGGRAAAATPGSADIRAAPRAVSLLTPPAPALRKGPGPSSKLRPGESGLAAAARPLPRRKEPPLPGLFSLRLSPPPPVSSRGEGGRKAMGEGEEKNTQKITIKRRAKR